MSKLSKKDFIKLQKQWYAKLKKDGFEDIETLNKDGEMSPLIKKSIRIDKNRHPHIIDPTLEYYSRASDLLRNRDWTDLKEKAIWELHTEGIPYRNIVESFNKGKKKANKISLFTVFKIINKLKLELCPDNNDTILELNETEDSYEQRVKPDNPDTGTTAGG